MIMTMIMCNQLKQRLLILSLYAIRICIYYSRHRFSVQNIFFLNGKIRGKCNQSVFNYTASDSISSGYNKIYSIKFIRQKPKQMLQREVLE